MFKRIVAGADGSDSSMRAVRRAAELAARCDATLMVLTVHDQGVDPGTVVDRLAAETPGTVRAEAGEPAEMILTVADEEGADLLVLGNRGMRGMSRFLGSVPNKVSHHLTTSMLLVDTAHDRATAPYTVVIVGTDGSASASRAVATAGDVAERYDAPLMVVHCYRGEAGSRHDLDAKTLLGAGYASVRGGAGGRQAWEPLDTARHALGAREASYEHRRGTPEDVLVGLAGQESNALLVTGSRGLTGPSRFLGSVPNSLTHTAPCDVLIVHTVA